MIVPQKGDTVRTNLFKRRSKMLKLNAMGFSLAEIVNHLALEHDITANTLYKDWRRRGEWQGQLLDIKDTEVFFLDLVPSHREIYRLTVREYLRARA
jgi:transposase-like protein